MVFDHDFKKNPELSNKQIAEFGFTSPHVQFTEDFEATVIKVHDGDTVTLRTESRDFDFPLRLLDIDAPELNAGGEQARDWLKQQIEGEKITVLINKRNRVGKYGRLLGKIFRSGLDIGQEMLFRGLVSEFGSTSGKLQNIGKTFRLGQWV